MRLIDANALMDRCAVNTEGWFCHREITMAEAMKMLCEMIDEADPVDAEPVRHGLWDDNIIPFCNVCSECEAIVDRTSCFQSVVRKGVVQPLIRKLNFCPHCGAKMDAKEEKQG